MLCAAVGHMMHCYAMNVVCCECCEMTSPYELLSHDHVRCLCTVSAAAAAVQNILTAHEGQAESNLMTFSYVDKS